MTENLVDPSVYAELADAMGEDFAEELVNTFLGEAPAMIAELKEAAVALDADSYRRAAHSLKSNAETFGANALADQARRMELGGMDDSNAAVPALEALYARTADALKGSMDG